MLDKILKLNKLVLINLLVKEDKVKLPIKLMAYLKEQGLKVIELSSAIMCKQEIIL